MNDASIGETAVESREDRRAVIAIAIFALLMDSLSIRSISLLAPYLRLGLNIKETQMGYVMGALMFGTLLIVLPIGSLSDRLNLRKVFPAMLIGVGMAYILISLQTGFTGLLAGLFVLGLLRAGIIPLVNRLITRRFERTQRGAVLGMIYAAVPLGGFVGAAVLPALGEYFDWSAGYRLLGVISICGGWLSRSRIPAEDHREAGNGHAGYDWGLLRSKGFLVLAAVYGLYALSLSADAFVTLYLVDVVKISAVVAGILFGLIQLTGVGGRMLWGFLADRAFYKNRWGLLALVNWLTVFAYLYLIRLNPSSRSLTIAVGMMLIGVSAVSSWSILSTLLGDVVKIGSIAAATALVYFITNITDVLGPIMFGVTLEKTGSYQQTVALFSGIAVCTALALTGIALGGGFKREASPG